MAAKPPRAMVFDIGNVLLSWAPEAYYDRVYGRARREALFAGVDLHAMNQLIDEGADFRAAVYALADRHPEFGAEIRDWHDNWIELASPSIDHSQRLFRALKSRGLPVFILSNIGAGTYAQALARDPVLGEADAAFLSGPLGLVKPEPAFYHHLERETGYSGADLLFADDRADNLATAEALGWRVHLFTGPEGLAARLVAEGLLTEEEAA